MIKRLSLVLILLAELVFAETTLTRSETELLIKKLQASLKEDLNATQKLPSSFFYMGYGLGLGSGSFVSKSSSTSGAVTETETEMDVFSGTLKIGYAQENNNRWELSITGINTERIDKREDKLSGFDIDWYAVYNPNKNDYKPYWSLGLGSYVWEDTAKQTTTNENIKGGALNLALGVFIDDTKFEFEAAYKLKVIGWQELISGTTTYSYAHVYGVFYIGVNFKFNDK